MSRWYQSYIGRTCYRKERNSQKCIVHSKETTCSTHSWWPRQMGKYQTNAIGLVDYLSGTTSVYKTAITLHLREIHEEYWSSSASRFHWRVYRQHSSCLNSNTSPCPLYNLVGLIGRATRKPSPKISFSQVLFFNTRWRKPLIAIMNHTAVLSYNRSRSRVSVDPTQDGSSFLRRWRQAS